MRQLTRTPILLAAALAVAAFAAYAPALRAGFVFDDNFLLLGREALVGRTFAELWLGTPMPDYWPLTWSMLWIEWRLFPGEPAPFHVVNVVLHSGTAILLWRVLLRLRLPGAWLAALLFAVHPVGVESVAWISERKNVLSGVLALGAVLAWLRADDERRPGIAWPALGLFVLALLAKTSVVVVPIVLAAIVLVRRGRIARPDLLRLAPFFAASLVAGVVTIWMQHGKAMTLVLLRPRSAAERLGGAGWAIVAYLERAIAPVRVSFAYPEWPVGPDSPLFYVPLALVAIAPLVAWRWGGAWGRRGAIAFGYFAAALLPVIGLVNIAYLGVAPMSNHLQYLAMMGPLAFVGWAIAAAAARWPTAVRVAAAALVVALSVSTMRRAATFESDLTLWRAAAQAQPDQLFAVNMYTRILKEGGDPEGSLRALEAAEAAARDPATRLRIRSLRLQDTERLHDAYLAAAEAERIRPDPSFQHELGWRLLKGRQTGLAVDVFGPLARMVPRSPHAAFGLGIALGASDRVTEARDVLRHALTLAPRNAKVHEAYAMALTRLGQLDEARPHVAFSLGVGPNDPRVDAQLSRWRTATETPR